MNKLLIRTDNDKLIKELDRLVIEEKYESRNQLIVEILETYVAAKDKFICNALPSIVNSLCTEAMANTTELSQKTLSEIVPLLEKISSEVSYLSAVIDVHMLGSER